jgi:hypothetical protein
MLVASPPERSSPSDEVGDETDEGGAPADWPTSLWGATPRRLQALKSVCTRAETPTNGALLPTIGTDRRTIAV